MHRRLQLVRGGNTRVTYEQPQGNHGRKPTTATTVSLDWLFIASNNVKLMNGAHHRHGIDHSHSSSSSSVSSTTGVARGGTARSLPCSPTTAGAVFRAVAMAVGAFTEATVVKGAAVAEVIGVARGAGDGEMEGGACACASEDGPADGPAEPRLLRPAGNAGGRPSPMVACRSSAGSEAAASAGAVSSRMTNFCLKVTGRRDSAGPYSSSSSVVRVCPRG